MTRLAFRQKGLSVKQRAHVNGHLILLMLQVACALVMVLAVCPSQWERGCSMGGEVIWECGVLALLVLSFV